MKSLSIVALVLLPQIIGACGSKHTVTKPKEAWDAQNAPTVFGNITSKSFDDLIKEENTKGFLDQKPWSDSYWPLYRAGIADRWLDSSSGIEFDVGAPSYDVEVNTKISGFLAKSATTDEAIKAKLSPAEKYDLAVGGNSSSADLEKRFPFTSQELRTYASNLKYYEKEHISWSWMGSCHGWALASYILAPPKTPVLYDNGQSKTLFTSGDVRALITKAFADNSKTSREYFMGTRCELSDVQAIRDSKNRILDGILGAWKASNSTMTNSKSIHILFNNWKLEGQSDLNSQANIIVFNYTGEGVDTTKKFWLSATKWVDQKKRIVRVDVRPYLQNADGTMNSSVPAGEFDFKYQKSCRDLNPGAMHLALAGLLSDGAAVANGKRETFTIEVARFDQVWNQPVYGYQSKIGALTSLADTYPSGVRDPFAEFRAPEVKYLAHVYTKIQYGVENGPLAVFEPSDEEVSSRTYQYTLEFDKNKMVIGGEWHGSASSDIENLVPLQGAALLEHLQAELTGHHMSTTDAPDFIWRYPNDVKVTDQCDSDQCLKSKFIYKLHACSLKPAGAQTFDLDGTRIPYVDCR
jgi:Transglutaminase elicitor